MKQPTVLIAGAALCLGLLAVWTAWPDGAGAAVGGAVAKAPPPRSVAPAAVRTVAAAPSTNPQPPARERAASRQPVTNAALHLRIRAAAGTPAFGFVRLLRRPEFAPNVRFDTELWSAFASGPRGDLAGLGADVFDRLARLGYATVVERPWTAGVDLAVALSARAIGFAHLRHGGTVEVHTFAAAELRPDGKGELWAWSDSDFVGPHRAGTGRPVPAARTCAVQVVRAPALRLRFFDPVLPIAGQTIALFAPPLATERALSVAAGTLLLSPGRPPVPGKEVLLSLAEVPAAATVEVHEEGEPWGCYVDCEHGGAPRFLQNAVR